MAENLRRLVDIARIDERSSKPRLDKTELSELMKQETELFEPLAQMKGIELKLKPPAQRKITVHTDRILIESVIKNLVGNALRYSRIGNRPSKVPLKLTQINQTIRIDVRDNGLGIS